MFFPTEVQTITEAYRSIYDNPNLHLDRSSGNIRKDGLRQHLAEKIEAFSKSNPAIMKYAEMFFRWLEYYIIFNGNNGDIPRNEEAWLIDNFNNRGDEVLDYERNVALLKKNGKTAEGIKGNGGRYLAFDQLSRTGDPHNASKLMYGVKLAAANLMVGGEKLAISQSDYPNIALTNSGHGVMVWTTRTFESTNRFIYWLWRNPNMNCDYYDPTINSPYCTRVREHWDDYAEDDANPDSGYEQYWFLKVQPNMDESARGNLSNPDVMNTFKAMGGKGAELLVCMNDSIGDVLNRYDEKSEKNGALFQRAYSVYLKNHIPNYKNQLSRNIKMYSDVNIKEKEKIENAKQGKSIKEYHLNAKLLMDSLEELLYMFTPIFERMTEDNIYYYKLENGIDDINELIDEMNKEASESFDVVELAYEKYSRINSIHGFIRSMYMELISICDEVIYKVLVHDEDIRKLRQIISEIGHYYRNISIGLSAVGSIRKSKDDIDKYDDYISMAGKLLELDDYDFISKLTEDIYAYNFFLSIDDIKKDIEAAEEQVCIDLKDSPNLLDYFNFPA